MGYRICRDSSQFGIGQFALSLRHELGRLLLYFRGVGGRI
ncbi:MAG: hypothetical protein Hyperionvirus45_12 [Hyperionvirus sp.]|uniref:Uncharacterized protein n=1 Tax=Hyperionvirus sp. TaxID=2487770 RepID=A0A3G5AG41_9VIRU|nr:MAG: hypothetical protein Hyperionvirus45_12 [Hyperionvirus sp.]